MKYIFLIAVIIPFLGLSQYVPLQSQYLFNAIALNPATAGNENALTIQGSFRSQWAGFPGSPTTETLSLHAPLKKQNAAFGAQLLADQIGVTNTTGFFGLYAYKIQFNNSSLNIGFAGGINLLRSTFSELNVLTQGDEHLNDSPLAVLPNFSFGLHYSGQKGFISFSLPQLLSQEFNGSRYELEHDFKNYNFTLGGGYTFDFKNEKNLRPSFLMKYRINLMPQFDFNLMSKLSENFSAGISYRTSEAIMVLFKVNVTPQFSIMYSFGLPLNKFISYSFGSHEIGLKYNFLYKTKISNPRFLGW